MIGIRNIYRLILRSFYKVASASFASKLISFLNNLLLARLIAPELFGKIAVVLVIFSISNFIVSGGMSTSIIRYNITSQQHLNIIFTFNIFLGIISYLIIYLSAPYVSYYFSDDDLTWIVRIMALDIVFKSTYVVRSAIAKKQLDFQTLAVVEVTSAICVLIISLLLAINNYHLQALSFKFIVGGLVSAIMFSLMLSGSYNLSFDFKVIKTPLLYGLNVMVLGIINSFTRNIPVLRIAEIFSMSAVGFFSQSMVLVEMGLGTLQISLQKVIFPVLSKNKNILTRLDVKEFYRTFLFIFVPSHLIFFLSIDKLVYLAYGVAWNDVASFAKYFVLVMPIRFFQSYLLAIVKLYKSARAYLFQGILKVTLMTLPFYLFIFDEISDYISLIIFAESLLLVVLLLLVRKEMSTFDNLVYPISILWTSLSCYMVLLDLNNVNFVLIFLVYLISFFGSLIGYKRYYALPK